MELFELGGVAATLVAAYQRNLLQALLNGDATPSMYAEELGLDPTATERVLEVLACLGSPTATRVSMAHLLSSRTLTPAAQGELMHVVPCGARCPPFCCAGSAMRTWMVLPMLVRRSIAVWSQSWRSSLRRGRDSLRLHYLATQRISWM